MCKMLWYIIRLLVLSLLCTLLCCTNNSYKFAVVGDFQQPDNQGYKKVSHEIVRQISESEADFVVIVGDLIAGTGEDKWSQFDELVKPIHDSGKQLYAVIGNNDCYSKKMIDGFRNRFGERYKTAVRPGLILVMMDSEFQSYGNRDWQLGSDQTKWLERRPWNEYPDYSSDHLLFFFVHRPIYRSKIMKMDPTGKYGRSKPKIAQLLESIGADAVFSGHEHLYEKREKNDVFYYIIGGGGGDLLTSGFHHFLLVTVYPEKKKWKVKVVKVKTDEKPVFKKSPLNK